MSLVVVCYRRGEFAIKQVQDIVYTVAVDRQTARSCNPMEIHLERAHKIRGGTDLNAQGTGETESWRQGAAGRCATNSASVYRRSGGARANAWDLFRRLLS